MIAIVYALLEVSNHDNLPNESIANNSLIVEKSKLLDDRLAKKKATYGHDQFKFDNPNAYADYHWGIRTRKSESRPGYSSGDVYQEFLNSRKSEFYRNKSALRISDLEFTERGPANVPGISRLVHPGTGR